MKNKRILVLPRYSRNGPSSRVRFYQFFPLIKEHGYDCTIAPFFDEQYIENLYNHQPVNIIRVLSAYYRRFSTARSIDRYDLVWLQYELLPWLPFWMEKILIRNKIPLIVDYDDAVFHRYDQCSHKIIRLLLGRKISRIMRSAQVVIAGNPYLADYAIQAGARRVEILPSTVDMQRYRPVQKKAETKVKIGWVGTQRTVHYLEILKPVFECILDKNIELVLIGAETPPDLKTLPIKNIAWSEQSEIQSIQDLDIGIMPLPDNPFERGKCGFKLIQYMACGLPVVASPVGVNSEIVRHGENGFLAETESEWIDALRYFIEHPATRKKMGAMGHKVVESSYSLQVTAPLLLEIFHSLSDFSQAAVSM